MLHEWGMGGDFGMGFGMLSWVLFWALVVVGIVILVRWLGTGSSRQSSEPPRETPLEILKKRYARGDIGKEEFEAMKKDLEA